MSESEIPNTTPAPGVGTAAALLPAEAHPLLGVRDLHKAFRGVQAVDGVSFDLAAGEVVSIIGPNGSGKSTLINLISGLLAPTSGQVLFDGVDLTHADSAASSAAGIARTFQNGRVFGNLSVAENVQLGLHKTPGPARPLRGLSGLPLLRWLPLLAEAGQALIPGPRTRAAERGVPALVDAQLARFNDRLIPRRDDQAYTLSYANRRRTEIARALVSRPRLLLLDEPTAGMNQSETAEVLEQLLALKAAGQTILLVEHKVDLVLTLSDRVLVMDNGHLIAAGDPQAVRQDPAVIEAYLGRRRVRVAEQERIEDAHRQEASTGSGAEPADRPTLLSLAGVNVYYGPVHALQDVSITVGQGEIVSLLGGNACGKSTTMKTVLGLIHPRSGEIELDGVNLHGRSTRSRVQAGIAAVPEARRVFPRMSVQENLLMGAYTRSDRRAIAEDLARIFDHFPRLAERREQEAGTMSGGEQQMLAFGRAMMSRPRLICMDEPTMGLSPKLVEQVLTEIARLRSELGLSVLLVEQQAELALSIADRGYVLSNGVITLKGSAGELLDNPAIQEAYLGRARPAA